MSDSKPNTASYPLVNRDLLMRALAKKHLEMLLEAGICQRGRSRTYRFVPRFQPTPGGPLVIDFGHCLIRLDLDPPAS